LNGVFVFVGVEDKSPAWRSMAQAAAIHSLRHASPKAVERAPRLCRDLCLDLCLDLCRDLCLDLLRDLYRDLYRVDLRFDSRLGCTRHYFPASLTIARLDRQTVIRNWRNA
jgi:hypothetical protein